MSKPQESEPNIRDLKIYNTQSLVNQIKKLCYSQFGADKIQIHAAYPKEAPKKTPFITYKVKRRLNAQFGNRKEIKPRHRGSFTHKGVQFDVWGHTKEMYLEFDIWGESGEEADQWLDAFEDFMHGVTGYLKENGVQEILFSESGSDSKSSSWKTDLMNRDIVYYIRLEDVYLVRQDDIKSITQTVSVEETMFDVLDNPGADISG